jgi:hypothetical protein
MLDFPRVLISVTAALIATLALFWSERGIIYEFGYPRDGGPMGYVSLLKVYVVLGWLFAMIGTLLKIEGTSTANAAAAAGLAGALFAGILRFYAMSRTFSLGQTLTSPPLVNEVLSSSSSESVVLAPTWCAWRRRQAAPGRSLRV